MRNHPHGVDRADAGKRFADLPFLEIAERQIEYMAGDPARQFRYEPVGHVIAEISGERFETGGKQRRNDEHDDDQNERCFPLERQYAIDDRLKDERLNQAEQAQDDRHDHDLGDQRRIPERRLREP